MRSSLTNRTVLIDTPTASNPSIFIFYCNCRASPSCLVIVGSPLRASIMLLRRIVFNCHFVFDFLGTKPPNVTKLNSADILRHE